MENLRKFNSVPDDFYTNFDLYSIEHQITNAPLHRSSGRNYFYGVGAVWVGAVESAVGDEVKLKCKSIRRSQNVNVQCPCELTLKKNCFDFEKSDTSENGLIATYSGPASIRNNHECPVWRDTDQYLRYIQEIVRFIRREKFTRIPDENLGFVVDVNHMFVNGHRLLYRRSTWTCNCGLVVGEKNSFGVVREIFKGKRNDPKRSMNEFKSKCPNSTIYQPHIAFGSILEMLRPVKMVFEILEWPLPDNALPNDAETDIEDIEMQFDEFGELADFNDENDQFIHQIEMATLFEQTLKETNRVSYFIVNLGQRISADFKTGVSSIHAANKKMVKESEMVDEELNDFVKNTLNKIPLCMEHRNAIENGGLLVSDIVQPLHITQPSTIASTSTSSASVIAQNDDYDGCDLCALSVKTFKMTIRNIAEVLQFAVCSSCAKRIRSAFGVCGARERFIFIFLFNSIRYVTNMIFFNFILRWNELATKYINDQTFESKIDKILVDSAYISEVILLMFKE